MLQRIWIVGVFALGLAIAACGDDEGGKVSEEDAVQTCQEFCEMDQCQMSDDDVMACQGLCELAASISACGNGQEILDAQAACYDLPTCDEQQQCLDNTPACEM